MVCYTTHLPRKGRESAAFLENGDLSHSLGRDFSLSPWLVRSGDGPVFT